jgi:trypsin
MPSLQQVSIDTPFNLHCTGTIINLQHVLTAASCVTDATGHLINQFWVSIIAGDLHLTNESVRRETRTVIRMYVHQNYNWNTNNNNIAVLRVNEPYPSFHNSIEPALRNTRVLQAPESCVFAGWGAATAAANSPMRLEQRYVTLPLLDTATCNGAGVHNNLVLATMLCAGQITASTNAVCNGNQGGGLYCGGHLSGVLAFGVNCGAVNNPPVFMDVRQYEAW